MPPKGKGGKGGKGKDKEKRKAIAGMMANFATMFC